MCPGFKVKPLICKSMLCGHTVQLLSRLLCCAHYRHEEGLSIHLPTSTPILYAHLSSSHLALHHLTRLQLFVSPFHPRSLSRPHLSASASSLPLTFSHLPHLSFVHLVPSISGSPWLFPSLSDVSVAFLQWLMYICRSWVTLGCVKKMAIMHHEPLSVCFKPSNL